MSGLNWAEWRRESYDHLTGESMKEALEAIKDGEPPVIKTRAALRRSVLGTLSEKRRSSSVPAPQQEGNDQSPELPEDASNS